MSLKHKRTADKRFDSSSEEEVDVAVLQKLKRVRPAEENTEQRDHENDASSPVTASNTQPMLKKKKKKTKKPSMQLPPASETAAAAAAAAAATTASTTNTSKAAHSSADQSESEGTGIAYTVSIALPGSVVDNAQSAELATYLVGQIARAATVFCVTEIIVFAATGTHALSTAMESTPTTAGVFSGAPKKRQSGGSSDPNVFAGRVLQYLECPQYLRKAFFPIHRDLQYAGLLNPLESIHHVRESDQSEYREAIVLNLPVKANGKSGSLVNAGLKRDVRIDRALQPGVRVTVKMDPTQLTGTVVPPSEPLEKRGLYWGYNVRLANSLSAVFAQCPYKGGYDLSIGISSSDGDLIQHSGLDKKGPGSFKHLLVVFGGVDGLTACLEADQQLEADDPRQLFDYYINTVPRMGSKTIRTEEEILVALSALQPILF